MTSARGRSLRSHLMWLYVLLAIFSRAFGGIYVFFIV